MPQLIRVNENLYVRKHAISCVALRDGKVVIFGPEFQHGLPISLPDDPDLSARDLFNRVVQELNR